MLGVKGKEHVIARVKGMNTPQGMPELPNYLKLPYAGYKFKKGEVGHTYDIAMALGGAAELERFAQAICEIEKFTDGFYKVGLDDCGQCYAKALKDESYKPLEPREAYLCELYGQWTDRARETAAEFMAGIPAKLKVYGFSSVQATGSMMQAQKILADVVDAKAKNASKRSLPALDALKISRDYNAAVAVKSSVAPVKYTCEL